MSKYYKLDGYDLVLLTVVLIELQNPKLQHAKKGDFLSIVKEIYRSLPAYVHYTIDRYFETIFFGRN
ncbi:hypothetical protein A9G24_08375 [Gilliamella sp. App6-5]|nr:hypothetical protein A9G24_08375 [Gilliamella apicola]